MSAIPTRILVANDQEWTGRSLESIFAAEGWEVLRAYTGLQAFDRSLEARPDLIVLDFQLPDISGDSAAGSGRTRGSAGSACRHATAGSNGRARRAGARGDVGFRGPAVRWAAAAGPAGHLPPRM
jgi:CheY-like chemotaxis protein